MNAGHITQAVAAMEVAVAYLRATPYTTLSEHQEKWKAMDGLVLSTNELKAQMSRIDIEVQVEK